VADGYDYDLFTIGAGSGGVAASRRAASYGARVAIAENWRVGGTCVLRGCVPKKLLVYGTHFAHEMEDARGYGWSVEGSLDWGKLVAAKNRETDRLEGIYRNMLAAAKVETLMGHARLKDAHTVEIGGRSVTAKYVLVASGGRPERPAIPGIEHTITSNEALDLPALPRRVVIAGGGFIAVEFAGIFRAAGAEVTIVIRGDKILRGFDEDLRDGLMEALPHRGITPIMGQVFTRIDKRDDGLHVSLKDGRVLVADQVMFAIGRSPNTGGLGLEEAGVELGLRGEIKVDRHSRTNVPSIYAVGDVTDRVNLTPVAIREGHAFADTVFGNRPWTADHELIPTAVFSEPEIGTVGLSEADARAKFGTLDIYKARFRPMKYTLSGREERMLMKLVVDQRSQKVVGCHILGPDAGEIVQSVAIAMKMGATKADFDRTMALHPSAAEELVTMREKWVAPSKSA